MNPIDVPIDVAKNMWGVQYSPHSAIIDFSRSLPPKELVVEKFIGHGMSLDHSRVLQINDAFHRPHISAESSLERIVGKHKGETVVFVGAGPSAEGIKERLAPYRSQVTVAALNKAIGYIGDPEYAMLYDRMSYPDWWEHVDPARTTLLTSPMANFELLEKWSAGNKYYSWLIDNRDPFRPEWESLTPLVSAGTTATAGLHALVRLGFKRCLLVGFDFCAYGTQGKDGKESMGTVQFYCDGTPINKTWAVTKEPTEVLDLNGERAWTNSSLMVNLECMQATCVIAERAGMRVYNCAERGLLDIFRKVKLEDALSALTPGASAATGGVV